MTLLDNLKRIYPLKKSTQDNEREQINKFFKYTIDILENTPTTSVSTSDTTTTHYLNFDNIEELLNNKADIYHTHTTENITNIDDDNVLDGEYLVFNSSSSNWETTSTIPVSTLNGVISYANLPFNSINVTNWNTAYTWGDHANAGYLSGDIQEWIPDNNNVNRFYFGDPDDIFGGYTYFAINDPNAIQFYIDGPSNPNSEFPTMEISENSITCSVSLSTSNIVATGTIKQNSSDNVLDETLFNDNIYWTGRHTISHVANPQLIIKDAAGTNAQIQLRDDANQIVGNWNTSNGNVYHDARLSGGQMIFRTNGIYEAMRIASNQNVGIGTSSPGEKLEVKDGGTNAALLLTNSGTSGNSWRWSSRSDGSLRLTVLNGRTPLDIFSDGHIHALDGGIMVGFPTGGYLGEGTVNAEAVYDDNTLLTDYVFDKLLGGESFEYSEDIRAKYDALDSNLFDPSVYATFWKHYRRLPGMPDLNDTIEGKVKLPHGDLIHRLIETCELQAIHIEHLRSRVTELEKA